MRYVKGDATFPQLVEGDQAIICHCCNDEGGWGSGFVLAINKRWSLPQIAYRRWSKEKVTPSLVTREGWVQHKIPESQQIPFRLGAVQYVDVTDDITVANIIGQHKTIKSGSIRPVRYTAIREGLRVVGDTCRGRNAKFGKSKGITMSVHMPRMGCGLARGDWSRIELIIQDELKGVDVVVYDLP